MTKCSGVIGTKKAILSAIVVQSDFKIVDNEAILRNVVIPKKIKIVPEVMKKT